MKSVDGYDKLEVFTCAACDFVCSQLSLLQSHVLLHRASYALEDGSVKPKQAIELCSKCGRTFLDLEEYQTHLQTHNLLMKYSCEICGKKFKAASYKKHHMATHFRTENVVCPVCQKAFSSKKNLSVHMATHEETDPFCCDICGRSFKKKYSFDIHLMRHGKSPMPYQCPLCERGFLSFKILKDHIDRVHDGDEGNDGVDICKCHTCGKSFASMSEVLSHASIHQSDTKAYSCHLCPRSFTSKQALSTHIRRHEDFPHQCSRCYKQFDASDRLAIHKKKCETRDLSYKISRPFKCKECPRSFCSAQGLYKHGRYYHNVAATTRRGRKKLRPGPQRVYTCVHCNLTMIGETEYRQHMVQHVAKVMYVCGTCDQQFPSEAKLKFHMTEHSGVLLYKCGICRNASYANASQLKDHIDKHGERGAR